MNPEQFTSRLCRMPRQAWLVAGLCGLFAAAALILGAAASDQPADDHVGVIEGDNIAINGPMSVESVAGQVKTILRSGSDVRVKNGQAKITLVEGGQISICGPAHLSLLKSGGTLTIALDSGVIHVHVDRDPALAIYTPQIQGHTVAIGDDPRDLVVGFDSSNVMCIRTNRGALHIQQQLGDENILIPQGGDVLLTNGQLQTLRSGEGHCRCELQIAKTAPVPPVATAANGNSGNGSAADPPGDAAESAQALTSGGESSAAATDKPAPQDGLIYEITMPPLVYDASKKVQPEPDPRIMVIVKRVRVRPTLIFQGHVEGNSTAPPAAQSAQASSPAATRAAAVAPAKPAPPPSFSERVRSFFHGLWSRSGS